jgi:hypothetical protein
MLNAVMKQRPRFWAACLLLLAACGEAEKASNDSVTVKLPPAATPVGPDSSYTSLETTSCTALENKSGQRCLGSAGYALETSSRGLTIIAPDGRRSELALTKLGAKAEWRAPLPGHPTALIVRAKRDLVVARLKYPGCIVAIVKPQVRQNEKAREIADGKLPSCLKG